RGTGGHSLEQDLEGQDAGLDEVRIKSGECGLEAGKAERRGLERDVLLVSRMRLVVIGDRDDRSVLQPLDECGAIRGGPQRRGPLSGWGQRAGRVVGCVSA